MSNTKTNSPSPANTRDALYAEALAAVENTLALEAESLQTALGRVQADPTPFQRALELLNAALDRNGKIVVTGVGKSGKIAQKISATLSSTGSHSAFLHPTEALHGDLGFVRAEDCVLALSYTGNTEELLKILPSFRARNIAIVSICGRADSALAKGSDVFLDGSVRQEACPNNLAPTSSTTLALAMGDALAVGLMRLRRFDSGAFALNHPGGSLGRRLTLTVKDVMHAKPGVAILPPDSPMDEVVVALTQKNLGAVLISDPSGDLLGIITEGDVRRSLSHRERFFSLRADEVMTVSPITVTDGVLAEEALKRMRDRSSQINVLPVVANDSKRIEGLVRLYDLLKIL